MPRGLAFSLITLGCLFSGVAGVSAQDDASARAAARALFEEGVELADRNEWADAADRFERAYQLRASPVIANNLAMAYVAVGRFVEASEHLRTVLRDDSAAEAVRQAAQAELDRILPRMGRMTIHLEGPQAGVMLAVDGREVDLAIVDSAIPANPGTRSVAVARNDEEVARGEVEVVAGATAELTLTIPELPRVEEEPAGPPLTPVPTEREVESSSVLGAWWFWAIVGVAVAGGVAAGLLLGSSDSMDPVCGNLGCTEVP